VRYLSKALWLAVVWPLLCSAETAAPDVNAVDEDGSTALMLAVHENDVPRIDELLKAKADVRHMNDYGASALAEAAIVGNVAVIEKLLKAGADVESPNAKGQTALMTLARTSNLAAVRVLIKHGANVNAVEQVRGQTPLMWAAAQSQPAMVRELVARGANVNAVSFMPQNIRQVSGEPRAQSRPSGGFTPLLFAARQGCVDCVRALLDKQARIDQSDPDGITPLVMAVDNFNFDTAALLLARGANPNLWDWWGRSALYLAVDLNTVPRGGRSDMASLDKTTSFEMIDLLLKAGANPNLQLKLFPPYRALGPDRGGDTLLTFGTTPLLRAARAADVPAVKLLLARGALPDLPQTLGITPLMAASGLGASSVDTRGTLRTQPAMIEAIKLLLAAKADINNADKLGRTALHGAAFWGFNDVVSALVANKATIAAKDAQGFTAEDYAMGKGGGAGRRGQGVTVHEDTAKLLRDLAASQKL
jgi:ankyrin repeat protein